MENLTVSFSRPRKFKLFSWLIMKVDKAPFSHVSVSWNSDSLQRTIVYQASGLAVNFVGGKRFEDTHEVIWKIELPMTPETKTKVVQFAMDNVGLPYGIKEIFGLGYIKLAELLGYSVNNPFSNGAKSYICCELTAEILKAYFNSDLGTELENLTPKRLYNILNPLSK